MTRSGPSGCSHEKSSAFRMAWRVFGESMRYRANPSGGDFGFSGARVVICLGGFSEGMPSSRYLSFFKNGAKGLAGKVLMFLFSGDKRSQAWLDGKEHRSEIVEGLPVADNAAKWAEDLEGQC